jgi:predicted GH43/DUF377 family glycosyl hydrolase
MTTFRTYRGSPIELKPGVTPEDVTNPTELREALAEKLREELKGTSTPKLWRFSRVPLPMLTSGPAGSWDEKNIEGPKVIRGPFENYNKTYWMFYHAEDAAAVYRIGVAKANSLYGPWAKSASNPILNVGSAGSWEEKTVALGDAMFIKEDGKWVMWYCGRSAEGFVQVGLATAASPEGPWVKYAGNPIIKVDSLPSGSRGGWIGGVVRVGDTYYTLYPDDWDYAPNLYLYTAPAPEGPWTNQGLAFSADKFGWEREGLTPGCLIYLDGVFYQFYSGAVSKWAGGTRISSIGYAWSVDGKNWVKPSCNPILEPTQIDGDFARECLEHPFLFIEQGKSYLYTRCTNWKNGLRAIGLYVGIQPDVFRLYQAGTATPFAGSTISSGSLTSHPVPIGDYSKKTIYFLADQAGTLSIAVLTQTGNWRTYDSVGTSANTLKVYSIAGEAGVIRVTFTPSAYPATVSEGEVVVG